MLRKLILSRLDKEERRLGASLDYVRHILRVSLPAFFKFAKLMPMATHRKALPVDAYYVARIVATKHEDCGSCVQIELNLAKADEVSLDTIRATLDGNADGLSKELADVYHFTEAVVQHTGKEDEWRDTLRQRYGEQGLIDLAFGITASRAFPTTKRVLGYAKSCSVVDWRL